MNNALTFITTSVPHRNVNLRHVGIYNVASGRREPLCRIFHKHPMVETRDVTLKMCPRCVVINMWRTKAKIKRVWEIRYREA